MPSKPSIISFKSFRIIILLVILLIVGVNAWMTKLRTTDWDNPLWVAIYPINGDGSNVTSDYIKSLDEDTFKTIEEFVAREAKRHGISIDNPVTLKLAPRVKELPPNHPTDGSVLKIMFWSLKLRYWSFKVDTNEGPPPNIKIFVIYHDPKTHNVLDHSLGLEKGLIGVVNAFSNWSMSKKNNVVIAHELLHTIGAKDKYNLESSLPLFPIGYAEPNLEPLHPQSKAEIMAGRIPLSDNEARIPSGLFEAVIGEDTAKEINWK